MFIRTLVEMLAARLGFVRKSTVHNQLHFARTVGKRLDEHREVVEAMETTGFFEVKPWHVGHMSIQDDYLMRLYYMVYDVWPDEVSQEKRTGEQVRSRPKILGYCCLPERSGCIAPVDE